MRKLMCMLAASVPLTTAAYANALAKTVSENVEVAASQKIRINLDKGTLVVLPGDSARIKYRVDFAPDGGTPWFFRKDGPTAKDYEDSTAVFDKNTGELKIQSGRKIDTTVKVYLPSAQALDVNVEAGMAKIGPLAGKVDAMLAVGDLKYYASALPEGACVDASIKIGVVTNDRDVNCKSVGAKLRSHTGIITVE